MINKWKKTDVHASLIATSFFKLWCLDTRTKSWNLEQSRDFGNVPEARYSPGTLGLSQRPRVPTPWSIFLNLSSKAWDSPGHLGLSYRSPGQSRDIGTVPKTQSPNTMEYISQFQRPKSLGQSLAFGTVAEAWDSPGTLGLSQRPRVPTPWSIFLNLRDPKSLGQSRDIGTVPKPRIPTQWSIFLKIKDPKVWDSPGPLGLSPKHRNVLGQSQF